jgi:hypothetical protein
MSSTGCLGAGDSSDNFLVILHLFGCQRITMVATRETYDSTIVTARAHLSARYNPYKEHNAQRKVAHFREKSRPRNLMPKQIPGLQFYLHWSYRQPSPQLLAAEPPAHARSKGRSSRNRLPRLHKKRESDDQVRGFDQWNENTTSSKNIPTDHSCGAPSSPGATRLPRSSTNSPRKPRTKFR